MEWKNRAPCGFSLCMGDVCRCRFALLLSLTTKKKYKATFLYIALFTDEAGAKETAFKKKTPMWRFRTLLSATKAPRF